MATTTVRVGGSSPRVVVQGGTAQRVVLDRRTVAEIANNRPVTVVRPNVTPVDVTQRDTVVRAGSAMGVQGKPGLPGGSSIVGQPVGAIIQGLRMVRSVDGVIYPVDLADEMHASQVIGLALQSVTVIGTNVNVKLAGPVTDSSWAWPPGVIYCGADGALTQAPPAAGWLLQVGRVIAEDTIDIDLSEPIYRG